MNGFNSKLMLTGRINKTMPKWIVLFILIANSYCAIGQLGNKNLFKDFSTKTDSANVPLDSSVYYFPPALLEDTSAKSTKYVTLVEKWYSGTLFAFKEPLLYNREDDKEVYRFTWLRARDYPIVIRIEKKAGKEILYVKESEGLNGYPGRIILNRNQEISIAQWKHLKKLLKKAGVWEKRYFPYNRGMDGADWILEGSLDKSYFVAIQWSPKKNAFRKCCEYLITLSKLHIPRKEKY